MKKIIFLLLTSILLSLTACKNIEKQIIGKWKVKDVEVKDIEKYIQNMTISQEMSQQQIDNLIEMRRKDIQLNYLSLNIYEFTTTHELFIYSQDTPDDKLFNKWSYNKQQNSIEILPDNGQKFSFKVNSIDEKNLAAEIKNEYSQDPITIILILEKQL